MFKFQSSDYSNFNFISNIEVRSDYETTLSIRHEYFCSEIRTNPIGSDRHTSTGDIHSTANGIQIMLIGQFDTANVDVQPG